jgi:hypothetical protein
MIYQELSHWVSDLLGLTLSLTPGLNFYGHGTLIRPNPSRPGAHRAQPSMSPLSYRAQLSMAP